jgi:phosphate transport system permease protein
VSTASHAAGRRSGLRSPSLSVPAIGAIAAGAVPLALVLFAVTPMQGVADFIVFAAVLAVAAVTLASWLVEGRRRAIDRLATQAALVALALALIPLGFVLGYTVKRGVRLMSGNFLSHSMAGVLPASTRGGAFHAIIGTVEQVLIASVIAVPLGVLVAIYVTEYGRNVLGTAIRFLIDVMTGIPSVVAGLFVLAFWVLALRQGFSGFAGSLALAVLELPIVVRATEEMLRLVPNGLREASYALGVSRWKTILRIVLPTASTGITTGVMLAVARVTGETAPVLLVIGNNFFTQTNPFKGQQASLPLFIFSGAQSSINADVDRAWAAALTLIVIVLVLYIGARLLTRRNALARR